MITLNTSPLYVNIQLTTYKEEKIELDKKEAFPNQIKVPLNYAKYSHHGRYLLNLSTYIG